MQRIGSSKAQFGADGKIAIFGPGRGADIDDYVDPNDTDSPVEDALAIAEDIGDATIVLPYHGHIIDTGPIFARPRVTVVGNRCTVEITGDQGGLISDLSAAAVDSSGELTYKFDIEGSLTIKGQGPNSGQGGYAVEQVDGFAECIWDGQTVRNWDGAAWLERQGAANYDNEFTHLRFTNVDAGGAPGVIVSRDGGAPETWHFLSGKPVDDGSGSDSRFLRNDGTGGFGPENIDVINVGGTLAELVRADTGTQVSVSMWNYEPVGKNSSSKVFRGSGQWDIGPGRVNDKGASYSIDEVFSLDPAVGTEVRPAKIDANITINNSRCAIFNDSGNPWTWGGTAAQLDNLTGGVLSAPVFCEGDGVYKKSTFTGYDGGTDGRKV
ncbi:hypothetical protein [Halostella litorea]|uniref:hypothetical protein n=1 Tax=Halostella litorea TaxID=2528831 RepID=UPI00109221AF|nr:hypothetical protein [Halostella litorea]